jgi:hypothetical protein
MEKKDILYFVCAIAVVAFLAVVVKPLMAGGTLSELIPTSSSDQTEQSSPSTNLSQSAPSSISVGAGWDGEVKILRYLDEIPANESSEERVQNLTVTPTPHIFVGESTVTAAMPVIPPHKPGIPEGAKNIPPMDSQGEINTTTIFDRTYVMKYNSEGFLVDVVKPPFSIEFTTTPTTTDPYFLNNPHYCFLTITVRDPQTMKIVAEEGYGRIYGTEPQKVITIYRSGSYHFTLYGNMVQVDIAVKAGQ